MWWRQVRSVAYLQHVTQHVHSLEYSQPKLWDAFWFFLWFGFFFLCVLNGSFFLYFLLKWQQQNTNRESRLSNAHNNARRLVPPGESCSSSGSSRITVASVLIHDPFFQVVTSKRLRKTSTGTYSERVLLFPVASPLALLICGFYRPRHDVSSLQRAQETREESPALGNGHVRNAHFTRGFSSAKWKQSQWNPHRSLSHSDRCGGIPAAFSETTELNTCHWIWK